MNHYSKKERINTETIIDKINDLFFPTEATLNCKGISCEFNARPILIQIYNSIFCFQITLPERPYVMFNCPESFI